MKKLFLILVISCLLHHGLKAQTGADLKSNERHQRYFDSIKKSDYKWRFPIYGKRLSKKGFDIPYPAGIMLNLVTVSQKMLISDLQVGINNKPLVPLDFIQFSDVTANVQTAVVRPDLWVFPFLDVYGLFGVNKSKTSVSITEPFQFTTEADFKGYSAGSGVTLAGGYHRLLVITDFNISWTWLDNIEGSIFTKILSVRPGMNFRLPNDPVKSFAFWVGTQSIFLNRTTKGTIDLKDLKSNASPPDLQSVSNETASWYQALSPARKEVMKALADYTLNELNGIKPPELIVSYSLIKKPTSNWSMLAGGQFQFNHAWQVRAEVGFLGGRTSCMLSGNFRFR